MYENKTYETIKNDILKKVTLTDKREGSFVNDMISPISYELERIYGEFDRLLGIMFVDDSAGGYIDKRGSEYGINRKEGTHATGYCSFIGSKGAVVKLGDLCSTMSGLLFEVTKDGNIDDSGIITLPVKAAEIGDKYNVLAEEINTLPANINGVTGVINADKFLGGTERENDDSLANRILARLQAPATSGNVYHYKLWAMDVTGVGDAKIFPLDNGAGTVTVMPITADKRSPGDDIITKVADYIEGQRPIGATVTVAAPTEVLIEVSATINISSAVTIELVKEEYINLLRDYIKRSVFRLAVVDYYKCLSMFYDIAGVLSVESFVLNGGTANITIGEKEIQVTGTVTVEKAVSE